MDYCMVTTTCPDRDQAVSLAEQLVAEKLAACAQITPIESIYSWQGEIHREPEFRLSIKSTSGLYPMIEAFITDRHPYELPEIIRTSISGSPAYCGWIDDETAPL